MPLIHGKSKHSFDQNVSTEMDAGKPQDQSLAIAYHIQRKAKKKKMASGGMPPEVTHEADMDAMEGKMAHAKLGYAKGGMMKKPMGYAMGGDVYKDEYAAEDYDMERLEHEEMPASRYAYSQDKKLYGYGGGVENPSLEESKKEAFEDFDMEPMEVPLKEPNSIAEAIIMKKRKEHFAQGGDVMLRQNAMESKNMEDDASFDALKKENYSEEEGLEHLDSPYDSNEHAVTLDDEDAHDMVSKIRKKMMRR